jgi:hypothetical protein
VARFRQNEGMKVVEVDVRCLGYEIPIGFVPFQISRSEPLALSAAVAIIPIMAAKHPKRPRDFSQAAKLVVDIASGQVEDRDPTPEEQGKDPNAAALGRKGGVARAAALGRSRRVEIAKKAIKARWGRQKEPAD